MANGFIDKARITVRAGNGGNRAVAFHRENTLRREDPTAETAATGEYHRAGGRQYVHSDGLSL